MKKEDSGLYKSLKTIVDGWDKIAIKPTPKAKALCLSEIEDDMVIARWIKALLTDAIEKSVKERERLERIRKHIEKNKIVDTDSITKKDRS